jgi:hypothetical protein
MCLWWNGGNKSLPMFTQVTNCDFTNNLTKLIVHALLQYGRLSKSKLSSKLICFGIDGVIVFQDSKSCVIEQLKEKHALLFKDQSTNFVVKINFNNRNHVICNQSLCN